MPVKNMVYDALQYAKQVSIAAASHKRSGDYRGADGDEYLSGFMKQDRLLPVVTLVVCFNGPSSNIHRMLTGLGRSWRQTKGSGTWGGPKLTC